MRWLLFQSPYKTNDSHTQSSVKANSVRFSYVLLTNTDPEHWVRLFSEKKQVNQPFNRLPVESLPAVDNMLDSKKRQLFDNITSQHRDILSPRTHRKALQLLNNQRNLSFRLEEEDVLSDIYSERVKDEEEEACEAVAFFDQPTPVIEMKSIMSGKDTTGSNNNTQSQRHPLRITEPVFQPEDMHLSFAQTYSSSGFVPQQQTTSLTLQPVTTNITDSLTTPVVDPNFPPFPQLTQQYDYADHSDFLDQSIGLTGTTPLIQTAAVTASNNPLRYATPPQYQSTFTESEAPSQSQLPESVLEIHHRQSISSVDRPSESSSSSPPPASPQQNVGVKRKRSDSDVGKKSRMTKKQQFDALCNRKNKLEEDNNNLKERVAGYERACRRLKEMLYNRIKQQRAWITNTQTSWNWCT